MTLPLGCPGCSGGMLASAGMEAAAVGVEPRRIAVIGAAGGMGRWFVRFFRDLGHEVLEADLMTALRPVEAAAAAECTLISVPMDRVGEVIAAVGPHVPESGLLCDVTSLKGETVAAMLASTRASVLGMHPLFGPGATERSGHRMVLCAGRGEAWEQRMRGWLSEAGLVLLSSSPEAHDAMMAVVQVLVHVRTQVFGLALKDITENQLGATLDETLPFISPAYLLELYIAARHFGQSADLYGPLEMNNPKLEGVLDALASALGRVAHTLRSRDQEGFRRVFREVDGFFGDFTAEATVITTKMIDRLARGR